MNTSLAQMSSRARCAQFGPPMPQTKIASSESHVPTSKQETVCAVLQRGFGSVVNMTGTPVKGHWASTYLLADCRFAFAEFLVSIINSFLLQDNRKRSAPG